MIPYYTVVTNWAGKAGRRKAVLFSCACLSVTPYTSNELHDLVGRIARRAGSGHAGWEEDVLRLPQSEWVWEQYAPQHHTAPAMVGEMINCLGRRGGVSFSELAGNCAMLMARFRRPSREAALEVLDEVAGPTLFEPIPAHLFRADGGILRTTALGMLRSRDWLLPTLADLLQDLGYTGRDLIDHLHSPGPHPPGCWALDYLAGF